MSKLSLPSSADITIIAITVINPIAFSQIPTELWLIYCWPQRGHNKQDVCCCAEQTIGLVTSYEIK